MNTQDIYIYMSILLVETLAYPDIWFKGTVDSRYIDFAYLE